MRLTTKYAIYLFFVLCLFAPQSFAQGASGNLTGAAPNEHRHKVKKKIDLSGNIHRSPGDTNFEETRGPDVLADCASKGISYTDPNLCNTLSALNIPSQGGFKVASTSALVKMKSYNSMSSSEDCLSVMQSFFNNAGSYSEQQKNQRNVCRAFCGSAMDTPENREFCSLSDCMQAVKNPTAFNQMYIGFCGEVMAGWAKNSSEELKNNIYKILNNYKPYDPDFVDPNFCIDDWNAQGEISIPACCEHEIILKNYFPNEASEIANACK